MSALSSFVSKVWQCYLLSGSTALRIQSLSLKKGLESFTAKNTVISSDYLVWTFCGKAQFPHSFRQIARKYAENVPFCKTSTPGNQVKLRYFSQCDLDKTLWFQKKHQKTCFHRFFSSVFEKDGRVLLFYHDKSK